MRPSDTTHHLTVRSAFNRASSISRSSWGTVPSASFSVRLWRRFPRHTAGHVAPTISSTSQSEDSGKTPSQICLTLFRCASSLSSSDLSRSASRVLFSRSRALFLTPCVRGARRKSFSSCREWCCRSLYILAEERTIHSDTRNNDIAFAV